MISFLIVSLFFFWDLQVRRDAASTSYEYGLPSRLFKQLIFSESVRDSTLLCNYPISYFWRSRRPDIAMLILFSQRTMRMNDLLFLEHLLIYSSERRASFGLRANKGRFQLRFVLDSCWLLPESFKPSLFSSFSHRLITRTARWNLSKSLGSQSTKTS